jgi:predicted Rossmann fold nucleotide-binding protein DprA/Smf involved in DNA uptake
VTPEEPLVVLPRSEATHLETRSIEEQLADYGPRVAIIGTRQGMPSRWVFEFVGKVAQKYPKAVVVSGGAIGVDKYAETAAKENGLVVVTYVPFKDVTDGLYRIEQKVRWNANRQTITTVAHKGFLSYGPAAYFRNGLIVSTAEKVVAFWDRKSDGTRNAIDVARKLNIPVFIRDFRGWETPPEQLRLDAA